MSDEKISFADIANHLRNLARPDLPPLATPLGTTMRQAADRIGELESQLADMTADYHRWHDAYLLLKYPGCGQRVASDPPPCKTCDGTGFANDAGAERE